MKDAYTLLEDILAKKKAKIKFEKSRNNKNSMVLSFDISLITGKSEKVEFEFVNRAKDKDAHIAELKDYIRTYVIK